MSSHYYDVIIMTSSSGQKYGAGKKTKVQTYTTTNAIKRLDITQGNLVKQSMGLSKRSHTTELFAALGINRSQEIVNHNLISLYHRICNVNTPLLSLTSHFLSMYISPVI